MTSVPVPALPHTWRPLFARIVGIAMAVFMLGGAILLAVVLPGSGTVAYHPIDRAGIAALGVPIAVVLLFFQALSGMFPQPLLVLCL